MALISCPECKNNVSDQAYICPHCGYVLSSAVYKIPKSTRIGTMQKSWLAGGAMAILAIALGALGVLFLFAIPIVGILLLLGTIFVMIKGNSAMVGTHSIQCPHCGNNDTIDSTVTSYRCPKCQQKSIKRDNYMVPVK